jgi:hypothetical protein
MTLKLQCDVAGTALIVLAATVTVGDEMMMTTVMFLEKVINTKLFAE